MNSNELKQTLEREEFVKGTYSLTGGRHQDAYCLSYENGVWHVYYSERGEETERTSFDDEASACDFFLERMRADVGTKRSR